MTTPPHYRNAEPTVIEPDISTPEAENPPEQRAESRTAWRLGPMGIAAIVVLVLVDLLIPATFRSGRSHESLLIGLSFGQMGAMILIASSARKLTWQWLVACYAVTMAMCLFFYILMGGPPRTGALPALLTIWLAYTTLALVAIFILRGIRQHRTLTHVELVGESRVQFGVRHLLLLMTVLAASSLLVRYAIPALYGFKAANLIGWVLLSVVAVALSVELRRLTPNLFWQLGGLAVVGVAGVMGQHWTTTIDLDEIATAFAAQIAILMLAMVVLRLEANTYQIATHARRSHTSTSTTPNQP